MYFIFSDFPLLYRFGFCYNGIMVWAGMGLKYGIMIGISWGPIYIIYMYMYVYVYMYVYTYRYIYTYLFCIQRQMQMKSDHRQVQVARSQAAKVLRRKVGVLGNEEIPLTVFNIIEVAKGRKKNLDFWCVD